jgi:hypothetical protein
MDSQDRFSLLRSIDPAVLITPFLGFLLFGAGLVAMYFIGQVSNLSCTRNVETEVKCSLVTTWMGLTQLSDKPLAKLNSAYVQESCDEDGCTYRVMLSTLREDLPLISSYSSGITDKQRKVDQILSFLSDDSQPNLQVADGGGLFILFPLFFLGAGLWMGVSSLVKLYKGSS